VSSSRTQQQQQQQLETAPRLLSATWLMLMLHQQVPGLSVVAKPLAAVSAAAAARDACKATSTVYLHVSQQ
jgi:hypothetical protein